MPRIPPLFNVEVDERKINKIDINTKQRCISVKKRSASILYSFPHMYMDGNVCIGIIHQELNLVFTQLEISIFVYDCSRIIISNFELHSLVALFGVLS